MFSVFGVKFVSLITDRLSGVAYQNNFVKTKIDVKDNSMVVNLLSKFVFPVLLMFGFYVHSHGDYTPGGGFQAGVIFACALCLYYFINLDTGFNIAKESTLTVTSLFGFLLYTGFGILGTFLTNHFLDYSFMPVAHPNAIGVFIVELGIAFVVFSGVGRIFTTLMVLIKEEDF